MQGLCPQRHIPWISLLQGEGDECFRRPGRVFPPPGFPETGEPNILLRPDLFHPAAALILLRSYGNVPVNWPGQREVQKVLDGSFYNEKKAGIKARPFFGPNYYNVFDNPLRFGTAFGSLLRFSYIFLPALFRIPEAILK